MIHHGTHDMTISIIFFPSLTLRWRAQGRVWRSVFGSIQGLAPVWVFKVRIRHIMIIFTFREIIVSMIITEFVRRKMTITDDEHDLAFLHHHHRLKNHNRQNSPSLLLFKSYSPKTPPHCRRSTHSSGPCTALGQSTFSPWLNYQHQWQLDCW